METTRLAPRKTLLNECSFSMMCGIHKGILVLMAEREF